MGNGKGQLEEPSDQEGPVGLEWTLARIPCPLLAVWGLAAREGALTSGPRPGRGCRLHSWDERCLTVI